MTRKDYVLIAGAVHHAYAMRAQAHGDEEAVEYTALALATVLAADNPRFDRARFLAACGCAP